MNDEIKINKANKSLTFINNGIAYSRFGIADEILDLITNLQQEKEDYKSRIEKAVEYINNYFVLGAGSDYQNNLLNMLQNGSDEE